MNQEKILQNIEICLPNYEKFENAVIENISSSYFPLMYQSLYNQLGYKGFSNRKFTTNQFKRLLVENNFLGLVNYIYKTRLSKEGFKEISNSLLELTDFDDYDFVLQKFEGCNSAIYKGSSIKKNAFSLGTKLLHYYNPEENPILDTYVRDNLGLGEMNLELCIEFKKATNSFVKRHTNYFNRFRYSQNVLDELKKRSMTNRFPKMQIIDMALY